MAVDEYLAETRQGKMLSFDEDEIRWDVDGNTLVAKCTNPHGFWVLSLTKGALPEQFRGHYSSLAAVERAARDYAGGRKPSIATRDMEHAENMRRKREAKEAEIG